MDSSWKIQQPLNAIIFDCDGTLSRLEGIDELAAENGVGDVVKSLTADAMASTGVNLPLYETRLSLVKPRRDQVEVLGQTYFNLHSPDSVEVIQTFQSLNKAVFIMSAGLKPAVDMFASRLGIPESHVYAVDIKFDADGNYCDFDRQSPLAGVGGKSVLVQQLKSKYPALMHVGDGMNDVDVKDFVTRFVGYGGIFFRESILKQSDFYIRSESLSPVLALALTEEEVNQLPEFDRALYEKGLALILNSEVTT